MRDDAAYLLNLTKAIDEIGGAIANAQEETGHKLDSCWCGVDHRHQVVLLANLRDYFLYLALDALQDPNLAKTLVPKLERCEIESKTHGKFFFTLAQLLSIKHEIAEIPGEQIRREEFEVAWRRTARDLGLEVDDEPYAERE